MQVKDVMTFKPACCTAGDSLQGAAQLMVEHDCGVIPIVESKDSFKLVGVVTDRDIVCRTLAKGLDPMDMTCGEIMSSPVVTVRPDFDLHECCELMERNQVRRIPVVDENGLCLGMVSQADIAKKTGEHETSEVVREVSKPSDHASSVAA